MAEEKKQQASVDKKPKSFEALTPALAEWILDYTRSMGFARTTPVQAMAIPLLMGNKDLVVEVCNASNGVYLFPFPYGHANLTILRRSRVVAKPFRS